MPQARPVRGRLFFTEEIDLTMKKKTALAVLTLVSFLVVTVGGYANTLSKVKPDSIHTSFSSKTFKEEYFKTPPETEITEIEAAIILASERKELEERQAIEAQKVLDAQKAKQKEMASLNIKAKKETKRPINQTIKPKTVSAGLKSTSNNVTVQNNTPQLSREELIRLKQAQAEEILAKHIMKNPLLQGVVIYVRDCPNNWQGCAYYTKGVILVDPDHTAPLATIIAHEVEHIIDWRSDGKIDHNDYYE